MLFRSKGMDRKEDYVGYRELGVSPDGRLVCWTAANRPEVLKVSTSRGGILLYSLGNSSYHGPGGVSRACFSSDGEYIATSSWEYSMCLWRLADRKCVAKKGRKPVDGPGINVFSPDGNVLVTGMLDGTVSILRLSDIQEDD